MHELMSQRPRILFLVNRGWSFDAGVKTEDTLLDLCNMGVETETLAKNLKPGRTILSMK